MQFLSLSLVVCGGTPSSVGFLLMAIPQRETGVRRNPILDVWAEIRTWGPGYDMEPLIHQPALKLPFL